MVFINSSCYILKKKTSRLYIKITFISGGTAVPGTVVSTTQDVQAASTNDINKALEDLEPTAIEAVQSLNSVKADIVTGQRFALTPEDIASVESALKEANGAFDYKITNKESAIKNAIIITLEVSDGNGNSGSSEISVPIKTYGVTELKTALESELDFDAITFTADNDDNATNAVTKAVDDAWTKVKEKNTIFNDNNFSKIVAIIPSNVGTVDGEKIYDVTITLKNKNYSNIDEDQTITGQVGGYKATGYAADAMEYLKDQLDTVTVDAGVDITTSASSADIQAISTAVDKAAKTVLAGSEFAPNTNKAVKVEIKNITISGNAKVTANISLKADGDSSYAEANLPITLEQEDSSTIVKLELVGVKSEISIGQELTDAIDGVKVFYADNTSETISAKEIASNAAAVGYDSSAWNSGVLGTISFDFYSKNSDATIPFSVQVIAKTTIPDSYTDWEDFKMTAGEVESVTSSDENIVKVSLSGEGKDQKLTMKAISAGTANIIATKVTGESYSRTIQIGDQGGIVLVGDATPVTTVKNIAANVANLGFVAHPENETNTVTITTQTLEDPTADGVVKAELTTVGEQPVIQLTPLGKGKATIKVTGGDKGKLSATLNVTVDENNIITEVKPTKQAYMPDSLKLNQAAIDHLRSMIYADNINPTIEELNFTSAHKFIVTTKDGVVESVPASDATRAVYAGNKLTVYYSNSAKDSVEVDLTSQECNVSNDVATLGLVATDYSIDQATDVIKNIEFTTTAQGDSIILITPENIEDGIAAITVNDELGNEAKIVVTVKKGVATVGASDITPFKFVNSKWTVVVPNGKQLYTLGDSVDVEGGYLECTIEGDGYKKGDRIQLNNNMIIDFKTNDATIDEATGDLIYNKMSVKYGMLSNVTISYAVKPASATVSESSLSLASGDSIASVATSGSTALSASLNSEKDIITIYANKTNISGSVIVTTTKGNTVAIKVSVNEKGTIKTSVTQEFEASVSVVDNTEETLGIVGTDVASSNESVVLVSIAGGKVVLTSVAPGTAIVTVTDGDLTAELTVTVDEFGTVIIDRIIKATDNGFVRGEAITEGEFAGLDNWYYYIDGEMVTNNWVEVNENGTNVWYHFDKDGKMSRGWIIDESGWKIYNLDSNGRMRKDMWINAAANDALGMPAGLYHLQSDGAVQMNGWAESVTAGIYWYCNAGTGLFEQGNPASWSNSKLW